MTPEVLESYRVFWDLLPQNIEANLKFAKAVINFKDPIHSMYFWGEYSEPILAYIIMHAIKLPYASEEDMREYSGDYEDFVMGPFDKTTGELKWYQLNAYRGENGKKLKGWLQKNGYQYFVQKEQEKKRKRNREVGGEALNKLPLKTLLGDSSIPEGLSDEDLKVMNALRSAWKELSDKDKAVLTVTVLHKLDWTEEWARLNTYVEPNDGRESMKDWTNVQKQNSISRLKNRAKKHLLKKYLKNI